MFYRIKGNSYSWSLTIATLLLLAGTSLAQIDLFPRSINGKVSPTPAAGPTGPNNETYQFTLGTCNPSTEYGAIHTQNATDDVTGCIEAPVGGFAPVYQAVAGYAKNDLNASAVGGYFSGRCTVNSSACWGTDVVSRSEASLTGVALTGQEVEVYSNNTTDNIVGIKTFGNFSVQPTNAPSFMVLQPNFNAGTGLWTSGYFCTDGSTTGDCFVAGLTAAGVNSVGSQDIKFAGKDSGGTVRFSTIASDSLGELVLSTANIQLSGSMSIFSSAAGQSLTLASGSTGGLSFNPNGGPVSFGINTAVPVNGKFRLKLQDMGQCTMSAGTCTAQSLGSTYTSAPLCFLTWTGTGTLAGTLKVASNTTTVTPSSSTGTDTAQVNWACYGN